MTRPVFGYALSLLAASALALPSAAMAAEVQIQATNPVIELMVSESISTDPDIANLSAGVTTMASTAVEAMRQNASQMSRVIDRIEALGIDNDDIQTSGVTLNAEYDYDQQTRAQVFRGYRVMNRVNVTLRDIDVTGPVLDALVTAGATDLGGIGWEVDDPEPAQQQAREAAFRNAREQALSFARMAGYADVRLLEISESMSVGRPMPMAQMRAVADASESTPVRPGQVDVGVTIGAKFEMVR